MTTTFNATRITERLIVGGGIAGSDEMAWLASQGVTHLISAAAELDDGPLAEAAGLRHLHIDWQDNGIAKPTDDFLLAYDWVTHADAIRSASGCQVGLYVHCAAGINRGPLLATFLLAAWSGLTPATCWQTFIKAQRPQVGGYDIPTYRDSCDAAYHALHALGPTVALPASADVPEMAADVADVAQEASDGTTDEAAVAADTADASTSTKGAKARSIGIGDSATGTTK